MSKKTKRQKKDRGEAKRGKGKKKFWKENRGLPEWNQKKKKGKENKKGKRKYENKWKEKGTFRGDR